MPKDFNEKMMEHYMAISKRSQNRGKLGLSLEEHEDGLTVTRVRENSAAAQAGLLKGDVLQVVNGRKTSSTDDLRRAMGGLLKGEKMKVSYQRDDASVTVEVTLG